MYVGSVICSCLLSINSNIFSFQTYSEDLMDEVGTENLGSIKFMIHISSDFDHTPPLIDSVSTNLIILLIY